jgi:hypothetical protein
MLLNEFLKEHRKVEEQQATIYAVGIQNCEAGGNRRTTAEANRSSGCGAAKDGRSELKKKLSGN